MKNTTTTIPAVIECRNATVPIRIAGDRRAGERDQVEHRDDHAERDRERHAQDEQDDRRQRAGDQADQQVAGDVAADRPVDVVADRRQRGCSRSGSRP